MDQYRKHYQKYCDPKKEGHVDFDIIDEDDEDDNMDYNSDNDEDNNVRHEGERSKTTDVVRNKLRFDASGNNAGEEEDEEEDEVDDSYNNRSPSIRDSFEFGSSLDGSPRKEESADSDAVRDSFSDSANDSGADSVGYENGDSVGEETKSTRNKRKERSEQEDPEEDEGEAPVYYFDDVFFNLCSVSNIGEADEQDVLIIGHHPIQTYLDIRDKDFFNVTSGDDAGNVHIARAMSHLEDSIHHPFSETVEEFYSSGIGIDAEYF